MNRLLRGLSLALALVLLSTLVPAGLAVSGPDHAAHVMQGDVISRENALSLPFAPPAPNFEQPSPDLERPLRARPARTSGVYAGAFDYNAHDAAAVRTFLGQMREGVCNFEKLGLSSQDINTPTAWRFADWTLVGSEYRLLSLNLFFRGVSGSIDLSGCTELTEAYFDYNQITDLRLTDCQSLVRLSLDGNPIRSLDLSGLLSLSEVDCSATGLQTLNVAGCQSLTTLYCSDSELASLELDGLTSLRFLDCTDNRLTQLSLAGTTGMIDFACDGNNLTSLDLTGYASLLNLSCTRNALDSLILDGCGALTSLFCGTNELTGLDLTGLNALISLNCAGNKLTGLTLSSTSELLWLGCSNNQFTSLDLSALTNLETLICSDNRLKSLDLSAQPNLFLLDCGQNELASLELSGHDALTYLYAGENKLTDITLTGCSSLFSADFSQNKLSALDLDGLISLNDLMIRYNLFSVLSITDLPRLTVLDCAYNGMTELSLVDLPWMSRLDVSGNELTSLGFNPADFPWLELFYGNHNYFSSLDFSGCNFLLEVRCAGNGLNELVLDGCTGLQLLQCQENALSELDVSDADELVLLSAYANPLTDECVDVLLTAGLTFLDYTLNQRGYSILSYGEYFADIQSTGDGMALVSDLNTHSGEIYFRVLPVASFIGWQSLVGMEQPEPDSNEDNTIGYYTAAMTGPRMSALAVFAEPSIVTKLVVNSPSIVEGLAATLKIDLTGENLDGKEITAGFTAGGQTVGSPIALTAEGGVYRAKLALSSAPACGTDCAVVIWANRALLASFPITLLEYKPQDLWSPVYRPEPDGGRIVFGETIAPAAKGGYALKIDGTSVSAWQSDRNTLSFSTPLPPQPGSKIAVSGVKYPELFPSYSFSFTLNV